MSWPLQRLSLLPNVARKAGRSTRNGYGLIHPLCLPDMTFLSALIASER
jgi:hypothetical protein